MSKLKDHNLENPKTENLHIRISPEDKKTLVEYADLEGITLSRFIMNLVRRKRIIICKDHRIWSSILLDIYRRVQNTTELAKKKKRDTAANHRTDRHNETVRKRGCPICELHQTT